MHFIHTHIPLQWIPELRSRQMVTMATIFFTQLGMCFSESASVSRRPSPELASVGEREACVLQAGDWTGPNVEGY